MKIICAGLSKTGTTSMARALRVLGFTVYDWPEHSTIHGDEWLDIYLRGKLPDFASMYGDVDAVTDLPPAFWYQEISEAFPDARVILTVRDNEDVWLKSFVRHTDLDQNLNGSGFVAKMLIRWGLRRKFYTLIDALNGAAFGSLSPESSVLFKKKYREHNERVQAMIPRKKLLVFNVKEGWKPLCDFLECEIPDQEFPWQNSGLTDSLERLAKMRQELMFKVIAILAILFILLGIFCYFFGY